MSLTYYIILYLTGAVIVRADVSVILHGGGVLRVVLPHQSDAGRRGAQL